MTARLGIVIVAVRELATAVRFYRDAFGWPAEVDTPVYVEFSLPGGMRFGVYQRESFGKNTGQLPRATLAGELSPTELYLYVDDPAAALEHAVEAGARLLSPVSPRPWGDDVGYCADPDGNVLALARPTA